MAKISTSIEIPVSIQAQIENLKGLRTSLVNAISSAGKDSSLAKILTKDLGKLEPIMRDIENIALSPTIDEQGIKTLERLFESFYKQINNSFSQIDLSSFEQIASSQEIEHLKTLTTEAEKYRKEIEAIKKTGSKGRTDEYLIKTQNNALLERGKKQKNFDITAPLAKNALAMEKASESYRKSAEAMNGSIQELEDKIGLAEREANAARNRASVLEGQQKAIAADSSAAKFHHAIGRFETSISANRQTKNPTISTIESGLRASLESVQDKGKISESAQQAVSAWLRTVFNISTTEATTLVQKDINTLLKDLMAKIFGSDYASNTEVVYAPEHSAILSQGQQYSAREVRRLAQKYSINGATVDLSAQEKAISADLARQRQTYAQKTDASERLLAQWSDQVDEQTDLKAAAYETESLAKSLYTLADAAATADINIRAQALNDNEQAQKDYTHDVVNRVKNPLTNKFDRLRESRQGTKDFSKDLEQAYQFAEQQNSEATQFERELKQSISHWMSAQQIVNIVKQGIRQAYQDIQGLDAAMTNIAVVTDMSVGDLWGKINEYMSIAQQYGVTTQGVYEVSQLYYQQGLSTNEVMAATTETLKMARIAGMGYAEAADAMTVAIRAFKMEMGDASHVTDVYSKVAAVTASDTEELAIAMSKTASSAESVGSSFENTTAMLAVMIETTRESAQNLGSALKSIISRYGEMKQGLTQDSDGEIIDYNKTDAALRSIGISIKDAQGQFRDFDDVIFELSSKWDSLDKNTQRYIATIMAGNRQQSRFIALVDNWERLDEVATAAQDSEDAGLLQYAKTMDSLGTKINNLKTSFQQFYMSIFDGEFFKGFIDIVTNVVDNLSKMGPLLGGINLLQLINQIKLVGQLLLNTFSKGITKIQGSSKEWQKAFTNGWPTVGERIGDIIAKAIVARAVPTGKEFVKGVKQGALGEKQEEPILSTHTHPLYQNIGAEGKRKPTIWQKANEKMLNFSPMTAGNFDNKGKRIEGIDFSSVSLTDNSFAKMHDAYDSMAQTILAAADKFDETSVNWAKRVVKAGEKFGNSVDSAAKVEYRKELDAADIEAQKEIAAAEQAAARQKTQMQIGQGAVVLGTALSSAGMMVDQSTMKGYNTSTGLQAGGAFLSVVGQAATGNYIGAAVTAITGVITAFQRISKRAEAELDNAKKASEEANVERAQTKETYTNLQSLLKKYEQAQINRYNDEESYQEWLDVNNQLVEAYPELLGYIDAEGHAIADVTSKSEVLSYYMQKAAEASRDYYNAKITELELQMANNRNTSYSVKAGLAVGGDYAKAFPVLSSYGVNFQTDVLKSGLNKQGNMYYNIMLEDVVRSIENAGVNLNELLANYNTATPEERQSETYQLIRELIKAEIIKESDSDSNYYVYSNEYAEYQSAYHQQNQLIGWRKGAAQQNLSLMLPTVAYDDDYEDLTGYNSLLYTYAKEAKGMSDDAIRLMTADSDEWDTLIQEYTQLYKNFSLSDRKMLNYLFENLGTLSQNEVIDILDDLGLQPGNALYEAYMSQWYEKNYAQLPRWIESYYQQMNPGGNILEDELFKNSAFKNGLDIHSWIKNMAETTGNTQWYNLDNIDALYDEYYDELVKALTNGDEASDYDPFYNFIKNYNDDIVESYLEYLRNDNALIASRGDGYQIAQSRQQFMTDIVGQLSDENSDLYVFLAENEEARNEFLTAFFTDVGTYEWSSNVAAWNQKYNYNYDDFANAEQYAYENYTIRLQTIIDSTAAAVNTLEEFAKKQSSGFTWEESQKYLKQIQQLDPTQTWHNLFSVNEQGLIVLKDFAQTADLLYLSSVKSVQEESKQAQKVVDTLSPQISSRERRGKLFQPTMTMDEVFMLANEHLYGEGIDANSFSEETYVKFENAIKTGEITDTFDLIKWYNNLPEEERAAGILQHEKDGIEQAFKDGGLTDLSEESYDKALELARTINSAYGLNFDETSEDFQTLVSQIRSGQITSVETLLSFYQGIADKANAANDVFVKQARLLLANTSFSTWAEPFTKGTEAKKLATLTSGSYSDLQNLWVQRLEQDWKAIMGDSQPRYEKGDQILENGEIVTIDENHQLFGQIKENLNDWDSSDYNAYFTAQSEALKSHGASLDAFGNLVVKDWNDWGEYIASSYGYSQAKINGIEDDAKRAAAQEARNQILAEAKASQIETMESFNNSMEEGFTSILQNWVETGEVSFDGVKGLIDTLQARGALTAEEYDQILKAYEDVQKGVKGSVENLLAIISDAAFGSGIKWDASELQEALEDAYTSLIKTLADALKSGIEGTLSATDFNSLAERYGLKSEDYISTATGRQLTRSGEAKTIAGMYDTAQANGSTWGLGAEVWETLKESGSQFQTYEAIEEAITAIKEDAGAWAEAMGITEEQANNCLKVFEQIADAARLDPDNPLFNFMEQDPTEGYGAGIDEMLSNINKAKDGLQTLKDKGSIAAKDFVNMFDFMYSQTGANFEGGDIAWLNSLGISDAAIAKLEQGTDRTINTYRDFVNAMVQYSGKLGEVDGKALLELGINIDTMAGGMGKSLEKVANDQIKFLEGIRDMLKAMKAMDAIGDIKLNFSISVNDEEGNAHELSFEQIINSLLGADGKKVQITIGDKDVTFDTSTLLSTLEAQLKDDNVMGEELFNILFGESLDLSEINILDALKGIDFSQFTEGQLKYISQGMLRAVQGIDPKTAPEEYRQAILDYIKTLYVDGEWIKDIPDIISSELEGKLNSSLFTDGKFKLSVDGRGDTTITWDSKTNEIKVQLKDGEESLDKKAREAIQDAYQAEIDKQDGFEGVQVHVSSEGTVTYHVVNPQIKTEFGGENSTFDGKNYTGKKTVTIDGQEVELSYTASADGSSITFEAPDGTEYTPEQINAAAQEALAAKGLDVVQTEGKNELSLKTTVTGEGEAKSDLTIIRESVEALRVLMGEGMKLQIDTNSIDLTKASLEAIVTAWRTLIDFANKGPINLIVNQGGNTTPTPQNNNGPADSGANNNNNNNSNGVTVGLNLDANTFVADLISLYNSITTGSTPEGGFPSAKITAEWAKGEPDSTLDAITSKTKKVNVKGHYIGFDNSLDLTPKTQEVKVSFEPTSANIKVTVSGGAAEAKGNFSFLAAGAAFARGTLMGELGPELYVQDGQYRIAGANGPEFVDLHNDAIVFNHLQTAKLLNKGHINSHGSPVTDERTAVAFATGNVSGPAHANSNIDNAIAAVEAAIAMWQNIAKASIKDMLNASGGGGGGGSDTIKAVTVELQEWYNLTRKIAEVEERINKLLAERENIEKRDGAAYLRNLREEQQYWREQLTYQTVLAQYQSAQLDRQREAIEQSEIWGQFFKFDSQGNIQFRNGNERGDGKGTLEFLQDLKNMSLEDQIKAIEKLGYSYTDADGNKLEGKELVDQFLKDIDAQMKNYESLYDTVKQAETKIEQIKTNIEKVEQQIKENQMDLEQDIYDTIVDAQEKVIEGLEEQKDLIEEANKAYVDGLNNALKAEKDLYSKNESISDREQLQRQLSLLRRSGGSASEIAALEEQLNDMLKNEYFSNQEDMIKDIEEANKEQIRKLEEQIKLQEEALEYQKEHGLIWSQVADIMSHDSDYILDFLQGNSPGFFSQSMMQQEQMLTEWAHKIGIFTEDRLMQNFMDEEADMWEGDKPQIFNSMDGELGTGDEKTSYGDFFNTLSDDDKEVVKKSYLQAYANARKEGKTEEEAREIAQKAIKTILGSYYDASLAPNNAPPSAQPDPGSGGGENPPTTVTPRKVYLYYDYEAEDGTQVKNQRVNITTGSTNKEEVYQALRNWANVHSRRHEGDPSKQRKAGVGVKTSMSRMRGFSEGGLVDYTGPAMVHGTPSKPEAFLNAQQTAMISEAVKASGDGGALDGIKATLDALNSTIKSIVNNNTNTTSSFTVAPGAVTIQVAELSDSYDVEELSKDVMNRIVAIASKSTNRGVNRR